MTEDGKPATSAKPASEVTNALDITPELYEKIKTACPPSRLGTVVNHTYKAVFDAALIGGWPAAAGVAVLIGSEGKAVKTAAALALPAALTLFTEANLGVSNAIQGVKESSEVCVGKVATTFESVRFSEKQDAENEAILQKSIPDKKDNKKTPQR